MACAEQLRLAYSIDGKVMGVDDRVKDVGNDVQGVDCKLDDINRSSSPISHALLPHTLVYSQGIFSATIFYDGFHLPIHP